MRSASLSMAAAGLLLAAFAAAAAAAPPALPVGARNARTDETRPDAVRVVPATVDVPPGRGARIPPPPAAPQADAAKTGDRDYSLTVRGRLVYQRQDGLWSGVDGILVEIWDDDGWWGVEQLSSDYADADGNFSSTFTYTNGADDPDIYLKFRSGSEHVSVITEDTIWGHY